MRYLANILGAVFLLACLTLNGCGGEPYAYETDRELKPGPGLFSGEDGVFKVISTGKEESQEEQTEKNSEAKQKPAE